MKKFILCLITLSNSLFSQTLSYSFSDEFETLKKYEELSFFKFNETSYASFYSRDGKDLAIQLFDPTFKSVTTQSIITLPEECKNSFVSRILKIKNEFYLIYYSWDRKTKNSKMFAYPFDKASLSFKGPAKKMIDTDQTDDESYYKYDYSNDSTKSMTTFRCRRKERKDKVNKDVISFNLFDSKMDLIYAHDIEMPYTEYDMENLDYEIDSHGNIFVLISVKINNAVDGIVNTDKENEDGVRFELLKVNQTTHTLESTKLYLDNKYISTPVLSEDLNHNLVIAGFYSDQKKTKSFNGAFVFKVSYEADGTIKNILKSYSDFPKEVIEAEASAREKRKMEKKEAKGELEVNNLKFNKILFKKDGSALIIGEEEYVTEYSYSMNGKNYTSRTYHYDDIFLLKIDPQGKTVWCTKIDKGQSGDKKSFLSYYNYSLNDNDYFIFRDSFIEQELVDQLPDKKLRNKGLYLANVKIDAGGKIAKSLLHIEEDEDDIRPRQFESVTDNLIVYHVRSDRKNTRILRLQAK
ncbi:MAG: hypothetical protein K0S53_161 [Bacteroidetes bacterium]|jgi:hypothetical protein|nr:hypothetical protein [Bacteroidota bacterium]